MAEIYFQCPVCKQRMSVEPTAAGLMLDCPTCRSTLVVPQKSNAIPKVETLRRMTVVGNTQAELYAEIERTRGLVFKEHERTLAARAEAEKLREELAVVRAETVQAMEAAKRAQEELGDLAADPTAFDLDGKPLKDHLQRAQVEVGKAYKEAEEARVEAARLQEEEKALKLALGKMKEDLTAAIQDRDTVATRLAAAEESKSLFRAAQAEISDLRQEVKALTVLRDEFRLQAEKAEASCFTLQESLAAAEKERAELRAHVALLQVQFEESVGFRRRCETLQQRIAKLNQQLGIVAGERDTLRRNFGQIETELKNLRAEFECAKTEAERERKLAVEAEAQRITGEGAKEFAELKEQLAKADEERNELNDELEKLRKERDEALAEKGEIAARHDELAKQLDDQKTQPRYEGDTDQVTSAELEELRQKLAAIESERDQLKATIEANSGEGDDVRERLDKLQEQLQSREKDLSEANERVSTLSEERNQARKECGEKEKALRDALGKVAAVTVERGLLQNALKNLTSKQEEQSKDGSAIHERVGNLERELQASQGALEESRQKLQKATADYEQTRRLLATAEVTVRENAAKLLHAADAERNYKKVIEEAGRAFEQERQKLQPLIQERDRLSEELKRTQEEQQKRPAELAESAKSETDALTTSVARLEAKLAELHAELKTVTEERDRSRIEVEAVNAGLERAKQHVAVLQSRRDQMREEISRLKTSLGIAPEVET